MPRTGRPKEEPKVQVTVQIPATLVQQLDRIRTKSYPPVPRSTLIVELIRAALEK